MSEMINPTLRFLLVVGALGGGVLAARLAARRLVGSHSDDSEDTEWDDDMPLPYLNH